MFLPTFLRNAWGVGTYVSRSFQALTPVNRRNLFYPTASPPPHSSSAAFEFPAESHPHLSKQQFEAIRTPGEVSEFSSPDYAGLVGKIHQRETNTAYAALGRTPEERWANQAFRHDDTPPGTYAGRSVEVRPGEGVASAYGKLQNILRINNVKFELRLTERHEKKGVKRRRLRSERWKRKFADEVRKKVELVTEIRARDRMWGARH